jgi:hypothetical protein
MRPCTDDSAGAISGASSAETTGAALGFFLLGMKECYA